MTNPADWRECRVALPAHHNWLVLDLRNEDPGAWARTLASIPAPKATFPAKGRCERCASGRSAPDSADMDFPLSRVGSARG